MEREFPWLTLRLRMGPRRWRFAAQQRPLLIFLCGFLALGLLVSYLLSVTLVAIVLEVADLASNEWVFQAYINFYYPIHWARENSTWVEGFYTPYEKLMVWLFLPDRYSSSP